jgi:hypothetical protein
MNCLLGEIKIADEPNYSRYDASVIVTIKLFEMRVRHRQPPGVKLPHRTAAIPSVTS